MGADVMGKAGSSPLSSSCCNDRSFRWYRRNIVGVIPGLKLRVHFWISPLLWHWLFSFTITSKVSAATVLSATWNTLWVLYGGWHGWCSRSRSFLTSLVLSLLASDYSVTLKGMTCSWWLSWCWLHGCCRWSHSRCWRLWRSCKRLFSWCSPMFTSVVRFFFTTITKTLWWSVVRLTHF